MKFISYNPDYDTTFCSLESICVFEALQPNECPNVIKYDCGLPECFADMAHGDLCQADGPLPDGNANWMISNCPCEYGKSVAGPYDVFKCNRHTLGIYFSCKFF